MTMIITNTRNISDLQVRIMEFVTIWARTKKVPIPRKEVVKEMEKQGVGYFTITNALRALSNKGYLRKAVTTSNTTSYVQLRGI